jgi:hypothetical protein
MSIELPSDEDSAPSAASAPAAPVSPVLSDSESDHSEPLVQVPQVITAAPVWS